MKLILKCIVIIGTHLLIVACTPDFKSISSQQNKIGYTEIQFFDSDRQRPLNVMLWYPAADATVQKRHAYKYIFTGYATRDAEYTARAEHHPLILLSHGDRGNNANQSWLAEALAANGYIVAAVDHWLNTTDNNKPEATAKLWDRPADLTFVLTQLLNNPIWGQRIDSNRIGAAGHSSGGYTVIALGGAIFNHQLLQHYCTGENRGPDCDLTNGADFSTIDYSAESKSYRDERIKAIFAMAPAVGQGIESHSLQRINTPMHIVAANDDEILKPDLNAKYYAANIANAKLVTLPRGGHFVFLSECNTLGKLTSFFIHFDICGRNADVDRATVHREVADEALQFFGESLPDK
ncbi:MAG TPA: hypothetical protein VGK97_12530 [Spongiibacteraceae bacterium]|jgi:predicted dienelactone hydrolase